MHTLEVLNQREKTHGSYSDVATMAQFMKAHFRNCKAEWDRLTVEQRESLDMIAVKIARVLGGNANEADHWLDIAGYATLVADSLPTITDRQRPLHHLVSHEGANTHYMTARNNIETIRKYLEYVDEHLENVQTAWIRFREMDKAAQADGAGTFLADDFLYWEIDTHVRHHDISKMSASELVQYAEWFCGPHGKNCDISDDGGFGDKEHKKAQAAFAEAWEHHKDNNPHHWEHWTVKNQGYPNEWYVHCICMVIDWMAMGIKFGDTAEDYYTKNRKKINLPEHGHRLCCEIFERLRVYG